jgi:hypothetical protein
VRDCVCVRAWLSAEGTPDVSLFCRIVDLFPRLEHAFSGENMTSTAQRFHDLRRFLPVRAAAEGMGVDSSLARQAVDIMLSGGMAPDVILLLDIVQTITPTA